MSFFFPQGTFFGLELESKSLEAFSEAENVTSNNIANVNTPGASRQQVIFNEAPPIVGSPFPSTHVAGTFGDGTLVQTIQRVHDAASDELFRGANSSQNFFQTQQTALNAFQSAFGEPSNGINTQFTSFQAAINQLVASPGGTAASSARQSVISQANMLAHALNNASNAVQTQEAQVVQQAGATVSKVNGILDQIAALNGQIRASTAVGDSPNTFEDQRDQLIDQLSQFLTVKTAVQADGSTLVSVNGQALVNDTVAYHLATPTIGVAANGTPTFKIDFATSPSAPANAPGIPLGNGQLAAFQDLFNNKFVSYGQQLDAFAQSLGNEVDRVTQASYDSNGIPGSPLFVPIVAGSSITAGNIKVGVTDQSQLPVSLTSTAAGSLVTALNSANNTVDTSAQLTANASLANPPAAALAGALTVTTDGVAQTFNYSTAAGGNADTIDHFISNFNAAHFGVTASFDPTGQRIVFTRDPGNIDLVHRAVQAGNPADPTFTIADSNFVAGAPAASLIGVLGANGINAVQQNATNALGVNDNGTANALLQLFGRNVGVPPLQASSGVGVTATANTPLTIALPAGTTNIQVGAVLTIDSFNFSAGAPGVPENVTVTATNLNPVTGVESITFTPANNHAANFSITTAQTQTLGQFYGKLTTQVGLDVQTANTGSATQTALANNINTVRQSIDGINLDEETKNLIQYQNAFSAAAKTINVLDSLISTVINGLGVGR